MANGTVLELASLTRRHPDLDLNPHCMMAVIRLSLDPLPPEPLTPGSLRRTIRISHRPQSSVDEILLEREIGWNDLGFSEAIRSKMECTYNRNEITEKAAIAVMGLLVLELEGLQISKVLPIGSGGDYVAVLIRSGEAIQVECSGIREGHVSRSRARLVEKCAQVLKKSLRGYVSVTTFLQVHGAGDVAHSFLHHVESTKPPAAKPKSGPRSKRR